MAKPKELWRTKVKPESLKNLKTWKDGQSGNLKGRPKGSVRNWSSVMRSFFELFETDPKKLEELTGLKVPKKFKFKDAQMIIVFQQYLRALKGNNYSIAEFMDRMDGKVDQKVKVESKTIADLIADGYKALQKPLTESYVLKLGEEED